MYTRKFTFCGFGNLPVLQGFGSAIHSFLPRKAYLQFERNIAKSFHVFIAIHRGRYAGVVVSWLYGIVELYGCDVR